MVTNLDRYKNDLNALLATGEKLHQSIQLECFPDQFLTAARKQYGEGAAALIKDLPSFADAYQAWYSEAITLVRQLLPDRLPDLQRHYEKPKNRKEISYENYRIEDYLQGLNVTRGYDKTKVVGPDAAIPNSGSNSRSFAR